MKKNILFMMVILGAILILPLVYSEIIWGSDASTTFTIVSDKYCCVQADDTHFYWTKGTGLENPTIVGCYKDASEVDGDLCSNTKCCYDGAKVCEESSPGAGDWTCQIDSVIGNCSGYATPAACQAYTTGVAYGDVEKVEGPRFCSEGAKLDLDNGCLYIPECKCMWENGACMGAFTWVNVTSSPICYSRKPTCFLPISSLSECSDGVREITWNGYYKDFLGAALTCTTVNDCTGIVTGDNVRCTDGKCQSDSCNSGSKTIRCLTSNLSFFSLSGFVISASLILVFYLFIKKR